MMQNLNLEHTFGLMMVAILVIGLTISLMDMAREPTLMVIHTQDNGFLTIDMVKVNSHTLMAIAIKGNGFIIIDMVKAY